VVRLTFNLVEALPHLAWLIPNFIQERTLVTLFVRSGCGKSFLALDMAIRVAQTSSVVYVAGEGLFGFANASIIKLQLKQAHQNYTVTNFIIDVR
jgi:predicted ATP-dependent serine protease